MQEFLLKPTTGMSSQHKPLDSDTDCSSEKRKGTTQTTSNRKVLMVTGNFVPVSSNNTFRALGFAEELPNHGWDPLILTQTPDSSSWRLDMGLDSDCPTFRVKGSSAIWKVWKRFIKGTWVARFIPESLVADRVRSWIPFAVAKGVALVWWHRIPVIFGSYQPLSSLVAAYLISKITNRPLISEFRDPILSAFLAGTVSPGRLELTRRIARHSKKVVVTSDEISADIVELVDAELLSPPIVLPHGFRRIDLRPSYIPPIEDKFVLTFTGTFYDHECIDTLCGAISDLLSDHPELNGRMLLNVIGRQNENSFEAFEKRAAEYGIRQFLEFLPWQSQGNLRAIIEESHIVWCTDTLAGLGTGVIIPGKLAKLFACGRPVLTFCRPGGATWRAVKETAAGGSFDYIDRPGIYRFVSTVHRIAANGGGPFTRNNAALDAYSFNSLSSKLADHFASEINKSE